MPEAIAAQTIGTPVEATRPFDIPAQDLAPALEAYIRQSGRPLFYNSQLSHGQRTRGVSGNRTPLEALMILLDGTGLRPVVQNSGITLKPIPVQAAALPSAPSTVVTESPVEPGAALTLGMMEVTTTELWDDKSAHHLFASNLYSQLKRALNQNSALRDGRYRATVSIWLNASGGVTKSEIVDYSGDAALDAQILSTIGAMRLRSGPPRGLPQPIHLRIKNS